MKHLILCVLVCLFAGLAFSQEQNPRAYGFENTSGTQASVASYGCKGDGSTDDTTCFINATKAAGTNGVVLIPKQAGSCYYIHGTITIPANITYQGQNGPTLCDPTYNGSFFYNQTGYWKIDGIIFNGKNPLLASMDQIGNHHISFITFSNNTVQNITTMSPNGSAVAIWGTAINFNFSYNKFVNIWQGGYAANHDNSAVLLPVSYVPPTGGAAQPCANSPNGSYCDTGIGGLKFNGGTDTGVITHNYFEAIQNDAFSIDIRPEQFTPAYATGGHNTEISYNEFLHCRRMGMEIGGFANCSFGSGSTQCNGALPPYTDLKFYGNYWHDPTAFYWQTFAYSIPINGSQNARFYNNYGLLNPTSCLGSNHGAIGFELAAQSLVSQANSVIMPTDSCAEWAQYQTIGGSNGQPVQYTPVFQDNYSLGPNGTLTGYAYNSEGGRSDYIHQYNYQQNSGVLTSAQAKTSNINLAFTNTGGQTLAVGASTTVSNSVISYIPIKYVQWYLDNATAPFAWQIEQDVNSNFSSDRKWLYHTTLNTSGLGQGPHTVKAVASDVIGGVSTQTQTFNVGTSTPVCTISGTLPSGLVNTAYSATLAQANCNASNWTLSSGALPPGLSLNPSTGTVSGSPNTAGTFAFAAKYDTATANYSVTITSNTIPTPIYSASTVPSGGTTVTASSTLQPSAITVSAWVTASATNSNYPAFVSYGSDVAPYESYILQATTIDGTKPADFFFLTGTGTAHQLMGSTSLQVGQRYHIVATYDGSNIANIYVNGSIDGTQSLNGSGVGTAPIYYNGSNGLGLGRKFSSTADNFTGSETNVQIWNTALTGAQVQQLYLAGPSSCSISTASLPGATVGAAYSQQLTSSGCGGTWSITTGALPAGLALSTAGVLSGVPTTAGTATFTVGVGTATQQLSITVAQPCTIITSSLPNGAKGTAYSATLTQQGCASSTWSIASGTLPPGLSLTAASGAISGTPTTAGSYSVKMAYATASATYPISISGTAPKVPSWTRILIDPSLHSSDGSDRLEKVLVDIDGDGVLDAVLGQGAVNGGSGGMFWYRASNTSDLTQSWNKYTIAATGNFYERAVAYDVNGDGAMDIVASDNSHLYWLENPKGSGTNPTTVAAWTQHQIYTQGAHEIRLADIDGDGKIDVVASGSSILGTGPFVAFQDSPTSWTVKTPYDAHDGVALLDIGSGHGLINIVASDASNNIVWYENPRESGGSARTGTWNKWTIAANHTGAQGATFITSVLKTGGGMDVVDASNEQSFSPGLEWYEAPTDRRNGTWTQHTIDATYLDVHALNSVDLNADGVPDVDACEEEQAGGAPNVSADHPGTQSRCTVFYNDGAGNFTPQILDTRTQTQYGGNDGGQNQTDADFGSGNMGILYSNHGYYGAEDPLVLYIQNPGTSATGGGGGTGTTIPAPVYQLANVPAGGTTVAASTTLQPAKITAAAWIKSSGSLSNYPAIISYGNDASPFESYILQAATIDGNNSADFYFLTGTGTPTHIFGTTKLQPNVQYFVAATYDGVTATIYVNGVAEGTGKVTGSLYYAGTNGLGLARKYADTSDNFSGTEQNVEIWNSALSAAQVQALYAAGPTGTSTGSCAITTTSLSNGVVGTSYSATIQQLNCSTSTWSAPSGSLPTGLSLNPSTGVISGTPTASGTFTFTAAYASVSQTYTITVASAPSVCTITSTSAPSGTVAQTYSWTPASAFCASPQGWSVVSGALPGGLNISSTTGAVTGTPSAAGTFTFGLSVNGSATSTFIVNIAQASSNATTVYPITSASSIQSPIATSGQTITLTSASAGTWTLAAGSVGTLTTVDSTHAQYTAPSHIAAAQTMAGCEIGPSDSIWHTRIDTLPLSANNAKWTDTTSTYSYGGQTFTYNSTLPFGFQTDFAHNIVDPATATQKLMYFVYSRAYNGQRYEFPSGIERREHGSLATLPGDRDHHQWSIDHSSCRIYETYQDFMQNYGDLGTNPLFCSQTAGQACNATSGLSYAGTDYAMPVSGARDGGATDAAGLPQATLALTAHEVEESVRTGVPIQHPLRFTTSTAYVYNAGSPIWPASSNNGATDPNSPPYGTRWRLKASIDPTGLQSITVTQGLGNTNTYYQQPTASITGCAVTPTVNINWASQSYIYAINVDPQHPGSGCVNPKVVFTPANSSTVCNPCVTATANTMAPQAQAIITAMKQYGIVLADAGSGNAITVDQDVTSDPAVMQALNQIGGAYFINRDFEAVDQTPLETSWGAVNSTEVQPKYAGQYAVVTFTPSSGTAITFPISLESTLVGTPYFKLHFRAGDPSWQVPYWVNADTGGKGATWAIGSCSLGAGGCGTITASGLYTPPASVTADTTAQVVLVGTSVGDPLSSAGVYGTILPNGPVRIDSGSPVTTTDSQGNVWLAEQWSQTAEGRNYQADDDTADPSNIWTKILPSFPWSNSATKWYAPTVTAAELKLWQTDIRTLGGGSGSGDIYLHPFILPNGVYDVKLLIGGGGENNGPIACWGSFDLSTRSWGIVSLISQGVIQRHNWDYAKASGNICRTPAIVDIPAIVTNRELNLSIATDPTAYTTIDLAGFSITPYTGSAHWEIDTQQKISVPAAGTLQMYITDWGTGVSDPVWTVSGPGTISTSGLYTAPATQATTAITTVKACSFAQPSVCATTRLNVVGTKYPAIAK